MSSRLVRATIMLLVVNRKTEHIQFQGEGRTLWAGPGLCGVPASLAGMPQHCRCEEKEKKNKTKTTTTRTQRFRECQFLEMPQAEALRGI